MGSKWSKRIGWLALFLIAGMLLIGANSVFSQKDPQACPPTYANISYGSQQRDTLDFWQAPNPGPRPVLVYIHGGGFVGGDKNQFQRSLAQTLLARGVSCASINYPFLQDAPIQDILHHAARAVQFIRSKSDAWNVDTTHIAAMGQSAGAGTSLWLNTHDDLANPKSDDPVLRESSRVVCCLLIDTQATYDLTRWESFLGPTNPAFTSPNEIPSFYHVAAADLTTPTGKAILHECDMLSWISKDDGPVMIQTNSDDSTPHDRNHLLHHPKHADEISKACEKAGVPCQVLGRKQVDKVDPQVMLNFVLKNLGVQ